MSLKIDNVKKLYWKDEIAVSHFLFFDYDSKCRRTHGHNLVVEVYIEGTVNKNGVIFDFNHLKDIVHKMNDHKLIVPERAIEDVDGDFIIVRTDKGAVIKELVEDVVVIPKPNTTSEYLSEYFLEKILERDEGNLKFVRVCVWEDPRSRVCSYTKRGD